MITINKLLKILQAAKKHIGTGSAEVSGYSITDPIQEFEIQMHTDAPFNIKHYIAPTKRPYLTLRLKPTKHFNEIMNRNNKK